MEDKISIYLKEYYKLDSNTPYEVREVNPQILLVPERIDLAAKLYYIHSKVKKMNEVLATKLYDAHIAAFQDGIIIESGNCKKAGINNYHRVFDELIRAFIEDNFDEERAWIPVDQTGVILDGAHRVACAIYFKKKIKMIQFKTVKGYDYDFYYFKKRALELEYLALMTNTFFEYKKGNYPVLIYKSNHLKSKILYDGSFPERRKKIKIGYTNQEQDAKVQRVLRRYLQIDRMEQNQEIYVSYLEKYKIKWIRFIRHKYTKGIRWIKKQFGMPL